LPEGIAEIQTSLYNHKCTHEEYKTIEKIRITRQNSLAESFVSYHFTQKTTPFFFSINGVLYLHYI